MIETIIKTTPDAAAVTELLVAHYGVDWVWQVEQLSKHFLWPWLSYSWMGRLLSERWGSGVKCLDIKNPRGPEETAGRSAERPTMRTNVLYHRTSWRARGWGHDSEKFGGPLGAGSEPR